jgi:hypothetical protein
MPPRGCFKLSATQAEALRPELVRGQEWLGVSAIYNFRCLATPSHGVFQRKFNAYKGSCEFCRIDQMVASGEWHKTAAARCAIKEQPILKSNTAQAEGVL